MDFYLNLIDDILGNMGEDDIKQFIDEYSYDPRKNYDDSDDIITVFDDLADFIKGR